jgi:metal-responsive CopG/Arc/MetJ family transcriptional regulator
MKMAASKIAITLENDTLKRLDMLVKSNFFPNRSKAIQEAVTEKLNRMDKSRLAQECAKSDGRTAGFASARYDYCTPEHGDTG